MDLVGVSTPDREIVGSGLGSARETLGTVPDSDQLLLTKRIYGGQCVSVTPLKENKPHARTPDN